MLEYIIILLGVTLFGIQHSGISALRVKNWIVDRWGKKGYARIFNVTSMATLLIAFLTMNFWDWLYPLTFIATYNPIQIIIAIALLACGSILAIRASGVISVSTVADMRTDRKPELITDGVYSRIRHPLYLATIMLLLALPLLYPFMEVATFAFGLIMYTLIGSYFEERKLVLHYGEAYLAYRKTAGFILPRIREVDS
jgi:protein-S-isoprenylcysteine O-methyltransferase Ste14